MLLGMCCKCQEGDANYAASASGSGSGTFGGCGCSVLPSAWRITSGVWSNLASDLSCDICQSIRDITASDYIANCVWRKTFASGGNSCAVVDVTVTTTQIDCAITLRRINFTGGIKILFSATKASLGIAADTPCLGPYVLPFVSNTDLGGTGQIFCRIFVTPSVASVTVAAA